MPHKPCISYGTVAYCTGLPRIHLSLLTFLMYEVLTVPSYVSWVSGITAVLLLEQQL
jgi:hypothetical protein